MDLTRRRSLHMLCSTFTLACTSGDPMHGLWLYYAVVCIYAVAWQDRRNRLCMPAGIAMLSGIYILTLASFISMGASAAWHEMFCFLRGRASGSSLLFFWVLPASTAIAIRAALAWEQRCRHPVASDCGHCGYDLSGTRDAAISRCPECGSAIVTKDSYRRN